MIDEPTSEPPTSTARQPHYSAESVRGGEIILRRPWQRLLFIAGLIGFGILAVIVNLAR
jgi:hypothetical protein